jgi:hypothetical protein
MTKNCAFKTLHDGPQIVVLKRTKLSLGDYKCQLKGRLFVIKCHCFEV